MAKIKSLASSRFRGGCSGPGPAGEASGRQGLDADAAAEELARQQIRALQGHGQGDMMDQPRRRILIVAAIPAHIRILGDHAVGVAADGGQALYRAKQSGRNRAGEPLEA
ncbi:MAG: hypothetical protein AB1916_14275 [Thermodesulfobacteriota bacterium]